MFGRTPYEAVQNFRSALQRAISCVTPAVIVVRSSGYHPGSEHVVLLGDAGSVRLTGGVDVALTVKLLARVLEHDGHLGQWRVDTTAYKSGSGGTKINPASAQKQADSEKPINKGISEGSEPLSALSGAFEGDGRKILTV